MKTRLYITIFLLLSTITIAFALPKPQYQSPDIIGKLTIPGTMRSWRSQDISTLLTQNKDDRYNFISDVFARRYKTNFGELTFFVLDAGNFHHPRICFRSSGYKIKALDDTELKSKNRTFQAKTLFAQKKSGGTVIIYWMIINKKQVNWTEQKFQHIWHQLFNKEKVGVMGRIDIPIDGNNTNLAVNLAQKFMRDIIPLISDDDAGYMFGI